MTAGLDPDADGFAIDAKNIAYVNGSPVARLVQMPNTRRWLHVRPGPGRNLMSVSFKHHGEAVDDLKKVLGL